MTDEKLSMAAALAFPKDLLGFAIERGMQLQALLALRDEQLQAAQARIAELEAKNAR